MSPSRCTPLHRSGATTAAVLRRRRMMRSAIVPSSRSACVGEASSFFMLGGDGARVSFSSLLSSMMSSLSLVDCGALGGSVLATCGVVGGTGGECCFRPGKTFPMNRACGET
eukprot:5356855-Pleurochrysis_carterae.AAC.3